MTFLQKILCALGLHHWKVTEDHVYKEHNFRSTKYECVRCGEKKTVAGIMPTRE